MPTASDEPRAVVPPPEIAVVFVNHHSEDLIRPRAARLRADGFEVVVADNSGTFGEGDDTVVPMSGNEGFGAGCNRAAGAAAAAARYLCFHNPDVEMAPESVARLAGSLARERRPGAVAPAELTFGHLRVAGYRYPSPARELLLCARAVLRSRGLLSGVGRSPDRAAAGPALGARLGGTGGRRFPGGGLLVVDRKAHEAIGGFDERYFLYAEDLDYWHRLKEGGYSTKIDPGVVADHAVSTGSPLAADRREILRWLGVQLFLEKFEPSRVQPVRWAHRAGLAALGRAWPELAELVAAAWRQSATPAACLERVRPLLAGS